MELPQSYISLTQINKLYSITLPSIELQYIELTEFSTIRGYIIEIFTLKIISNKSQL